MANIVPTSLNGNGHTFPISRKAFHRGLPRRVGTIEDQLDGHDRQLDGLERLVDDLVCRLTAIEARPTTTGPDPLLTARVDNIVEEVGHLANQVHRVDKRSAQTRRKVAVISDQLELQFK